MKTKTLYHRFSCYFKRDEEKETLAYVDIILSSFKINSFVYMLWNN